MTQGHFVAENWYHGLKSEEVCELARNRLVMLNLGTWESRKLSFPRKCVCVFAWLHLKKLDIFIYKKIGGLFFPL